MQPALVLSVAISCVGLFSIIAVVTWGVLLLPTPSFWVGVYQIVLAFLLAIGYGSLIIQTALTMVTLVSLRNRDYHRAELNYRRVLAIWLKLPIPKRQALVGSYTNLAALMLQQGKFDMAEYWYQEALRIVLADRRLARHSYCGLVKNNLAWALLRQHQYVEARKLSTEAMEIYTRTKKTGGLVFPLCTQAAIDLEEGEPARAEAQFKEALQLLSQGKAPSHILRVSFAHVRAYAILGLAVACAAQGRIDEAKTHILQAFQSFGPGDEYLTGGMLRLMAQLAGYLLEGGETALCERLLEHAYAVAVTLPDHPDGQLVIEPYARLLESTGRYDEISDLKRFVRPVLLERENETTASLKAIAQKRANEQKKTEI